MCNPLRSALRYVGEAEMRRIVGLAVVLGVLGWGQVAHADAITGEIDFLGLWAGLDCAGNLVGDIQQACAVDILGDEALVIDGTGDFAGTFGSLATYNDFTFAPPTVPVMPLWSVGGFAFDLTSMNLVTQTSSLLQLTGTGVVSSASFDTTPFDWEFIGGPQWTVKVFVNNGGPSMVVSESPTLLLLGVGLAMVGVGRYRRKK